MGDVTLGEQIKKLRVAKKMTLALMAKRVGVTLSTVAAYENGTRNPSFDVLVRIARLFNVTIDNLLGYTDRDLLDATDLSTEQRNSVQEIISIYRKYNEAIALLKRNNLDITEESMLSLGSVTPYNKKKSQKDNDTI